MTFLIFIPLIAIIFNLRYKVLKKAINDKNNERISVEIAFISLLILLISGIFFLLNLV